jgi:hypothetical protein
VADGEECGQTIEAAGFLLSRDTERPGAPLLLMNVRPGSVPFTLPGSRAGGGWRTLLDTSRADPFGEPTSLPAGETLLLEGRSAVLLEREG